MAGTARVSAAGAYIEDGPSDGVWASAFGAYVEYQSADQRARSSALGAFVEQSATGAFASAFGLYVEMGTAAVGTVGQWGVLIDWDFDGTYDDETDRVIAADGHQALASFGRSIVAGKGIVSQANLVLRNNDGRYSALNESSPIYDAIQNGQGYHAPIIIKRMNSDLQWVNIFTGVVKIPRESSPTSFDISTVELDCRGAEEKVLTKRVSTSQSDFASWANLGGVPEGTILAQWFDDAGIPSNQLSIDTSQAHINWAWMDDESPIEAAWELAEAVAGRVYANPDGTIIYENNQAWLANPPSRHTVSQGTLTRQDFSALIPFYSDAELYRTVNVEITARQQTDADILWEPADIVVIPSSGTVTVWARVQQPIYRLDSINYTATTSGGEDITDDVSLSYTAYAQRVKLTFTNANALEAAELALLNITGQPSDGYDSDERSRESAAAFWAAAGTAGTATRLGDRTKVLRNPLIQTQGQAEFLSEYLGSWYEEPSLFFKAQGVVGDEGRRLGDRYTITDGSVMTSSRDAFITGIRWRWDHQGYWQDLELIDGAGIFPYMDGAGGTPDYFIIGTDTLGTASASPGRVFF